MKHSHTLVERFWSKVKKGPDCWEWTASLNKGYGVISSGIWKGPVLQAHRVSWYIHFGDICTKDVVCHKCDNPKCVRPDHLFVGTHKDNVHDKIRKGRAMHYSRVITDEMIDEIRKSGSAFSQKELGKIHGIHPSNISRILNRKKRFK